MILNHLAAIVCNLLCLKLKNWTAGQLFVLSSVSSLCVCPIRCHECVFHTMPAEQKAFFILILHQWWKKSMFYKTVPCISDKKLQHRKRFVSELQWNHAGVRNSTCRSGTWLSHLASQGWGSFPLHSLCPWKGCRRAAFCCRGCDSFHWATYSVFTHVTSCMHSGCEFGKEGKSSNRERGWRRLFFQTEYSCCLARIA